jgi:hypothetical protein
VALGICLKRTSKGFISWVGNTEKCIDMEGNKRDNGTKIQLWDCNNTAAQKFKYDPNTKNIVSIDSNKCLDVDAGINKNGTKIQLWDCGNDNRLLK